MTKVFVSSYISAKAKILLCIFLAFLLSVLIYKDSQPSVVHADSTESQLVQRIQQLQGQLNSAQSQEKTLNSQLAYIDNQTNLTELEIQQAQYEINKLDTEISDLNGRIDKLSTNMNQLSEALLTRIVTTYKYSNMSPLDLIFSSKNFGDLLERMKYLQIVQENDKKVLYNLQATKSDYSDQKTDKETRQAQEAKDKAALSAYQTQLANQKQAKQVLLTQTKGSESTYQTLLAQAKAELASLARFATSRGGSIISHESLSDSWGKYYNQRDSYWGHQFIGYSNEQVWEVGCLLTSYAMVDTHFGGSLTPGDVAANPNNFSVGTAMFANPSANGHPSQYVTNPSISTLRDEVNAGYPVIAGLSNDGGPFPAHWSDHWVVLRSVNSDGSFMINDPWYPAAIDVPLNQHYAGWAIIEARIYR